MEQKENNEEPDNNFSDDPKENLRVENQFLQQVQEFENAWKDVGYVKVYDLIGKPAFKKVEELTDEESKVGLEKLIKLLIEHNINLDVLGQYEPKNYLSLYHRGII